MGGRLLSIEHDQVGREGARGVGLGSLEGDLTRVKNVQPSSSNSTSKFHKANGCKLQVMMCMPLVTCTKKTAKLNFRVESNYENTGGASRGGPSIGHGCTHVHPIILVLANEIQVSR